MSEESDFRDVLARAVEAGVFDECWDVPTAKWESCCLIKALALFGPPPEGFELVHAETVWDGEVNCLRPRFSLTPKKVLDVRTEKSDNEITGRETAGEENDDE